MTSRFRTATFVVKAAASCSVSILALGGLLYWLSGSEPVAEDLATDMLKASPEVIATLKTDLMTSEYEAVGAVPTEILSEDHIATDIERLVTVSPGDTLMSLLVAAGATRTEAHGAINALSSVYSPRKIRPGLDIALTFAPPLESIAEEEESRDVGPLMAMQFQPSVERIVKVSSTEGESNNYIAEEIERPLTMKTDYSTGIIDSSLYLAATESNVPNDILISLIRAYSYDVDFQREIQTGDRFEVVYEAYYDEDGNLAKTGEMIYGSLNLSGTDMKLYHFTPASGFTDYFNSKGQTAKKALMRTPIDGARLSSGFGKRKHPVLGYTKMHKGVDFAAPRGTPIYAAGDGVILRASPYSSYGNYVKIRHHSGYETAYAHMNGFAKGISKSKRVRQGQVIGYVGTTGRSTGPHLHYEVLLNNKQVNPLGVKLPAGEKLAKADLKNFEAAKKDIDKMIKKLSEPAAIASITP
ncbi:M23 family metallopeptidase [Kiloniella laminariae]|uniref:M23 family metallopeptidase n=1 Tax=Kiloniella laminariae TaxID=454162 RepID=A0ABT4LLZ2_9PROT|nr:M23 family metallopeptidase [Kiloniella laminariae]MCZ4282145.1 M23 family metallopeptidase [Kiloniella laminariae]